MEWVPFTCSNVFCGCESLGTVYDTREQPISFKVYFCIFWMVLVVMGGVKMGLEWFIFKDYYPLKEKSPILCIMIIMSVCCQLIIYPMIYTSHYFTAIFGEVDVRLRFRAIQAGLEYTAYILYFVRCMRIVYAHEVHSSLNKSWPFKIFQKQFMLALIVWSVAALRAIVVICDWFNESDSHFSLAIEYQVPQDIENHKDVEFVFRKLCTTFFWQMILVYCIWMQRNVHSRYSMKKELQMVLLIDIVTSFVYYYYLWYKNVFHERNVMKRMCNPLEIDPSAAFYPATELLLLVNLVVILIVTIILPLREKKVYHMLLPTGRHYGLIKTMRDFLMEEEFLRVFTEYLKHLDREQETDKYSTLLDFWRKLIILKMDQDYSEMVKLVEIRSLIEEVESSLFQSQHDLIINLKDSIVGLQDSITNSDIIKQRYRESINEKVDELEKLALQRLDNIYTKKYIKTQSYYHLKEITDDNKRVNMNMIMLNLALIVDSENEFS